MEIICKSCSPQIQIAVCHLLAEALPCPRHVLPHQSFCMETLTRVVSKPNVRHGWVKTSLGQALDLTRFRLAPESSPFGPQTWSYGPTF